MSNRDKIIILTVLAVMLFVASIILFINYSNCKERCKLQEQEIESLRTEVVNQSEEVDSLQTEVANQKEAIISLQGNVANQEQTITSLQKEVANQEQEIEYLEEKLAGSLPYAKADGSPITLQNNYGNVHNPTWAELVSFLESDNTESIWYDYASFICGDFAERVHNNAESKGIRAGIVAVHFTVGFPHALNVFYTTDKGLIYVDCTGETMGMVGSEDKIVYMEVGEEYGVVPLSIIGVSRPFGICFHYPCYEDYAQRWLVYEQEVQDYNVEVGVYNAALGGRVFLEETEYSYFSDWYDRLEKWSRNIDWQGAQLGDYWYESPGIVDSIEIYWNASEWEEQ